MKVRAHEVQKIGTPLLIKRNCAVQKVLKAGTWSSQTIFSTFYSRDVTYRYEYFSISPVVVAAGHVTCQPFGLPV